MYQRSSILATLFICLVVLEVQGECPKNSEKTDGECGVLPYFPNACHGGCVENVCCKAVCPDGKVSVAGFNPYLPNAGPVCEKDGGEMITVEMGQSKSTMCCTKAEGFCPAGKGKPYTENEKSSCNQDQEKFKDKEKKTECENNGGSCEKDPKATGPEGTSCCKV